MLLANQELMLQILQFQASVSIAHGGGHHQARIDLATHPRSHDVLFVDLAIDGQAQHIRGQAYNALLRRGSQKDLTLMTHAFGSTDKERA